MLLRQREGLRISYTRKGREGWKEREEKGGDKWERKQKRRGKQEQNEEKEEKKEEKRRREGGRGALDAGRCRVQAEYEMGRGCKLSLPSIFKEISLIVRNC